jgi:hypothetical protein
MAQDQDIEGSRIEIQSFQMNHGNRRMSIVPDLSTGVPSCESDRLQQSMQENNPMRGEYRHESEIVPKAVESKHITDGTAKLFLDSEATDELAYGGILKQLHHWQDKDVMSTYSKLRLRETPKDACFCPQDCTEPLYRFMETTARNDLVAGFLLKICAQCAQLMRSSKLWCNPRSVHTCVARTVV